MRPVSHDLDPHKMDSMGGRRERQETQAPKAAQGPQRHYDAPASTNLECDVYVA